MIGCKAEDIDAEGNDMVRRRLAKLGAAAALSAAAVAALPATAHAEERTCRGSLGARTVDNLRVPSGATCRLTGTYVKGTIKVQRGATLVARRVRVVGNVQAEGARNVVVKRRSRVGGSIQVEQGRRATVRGTRIIGDIQYDHNRGYLRANRNRVGGSIQVIGNSGGAEIFRNVVNGNLQCKENRPRPTGGGNIVGGNKEDQCRRF
jgi:hypothetical protein